MNKKTTIITLRVPEDLAQKIADAVRISKRGQSDLLREAVALGLEDLFLIGLNPMDAAKEKLKSLKEKSAIPMQNHLQGLPEANAANKKNA